MMAKGRKKAAATRLTMDYPGVGPVHVLLSARAQRITLAVRPDRTVRLTVPVNIPLEKGAEFLDLKKEWLLKTIAKYPPARPVILPPYTTRAHRLVLEPFPGGGDSPLKVTLKEGIALVRYPDVLDPSDKAVQTAVRKALEEAWRDEAKVMLPRRLSVLAAVCGLEYRSVAVRNTVSKWGSCSARDDISLSLHLMRLPDHLIDYILLHELCHTVHKNHGPRFHALLDRLTGGRHADLRRELKAFTTRW